jgi:hypothetical protein
MGRRMMATLRPAPIVFLPYTLRLPEALTATEATEVEKSPHVVFGKTAATCLALIQCSVPTHVVLHVWKQISYGHLTTSVMYTPRFFEAKCRKVSDIMSFKRMQQ